MFAYEKPFRNFWQYFEPVRNNMPANCSADVQAVMTHIDKTFMGRNASAIQAIKDNFGLGDMKHLDDVAGARKLTIFSHVINSILIIFQVRNNLWDWQSLQVTSGAGTQFYRFCDALEIKDGVHAPASGFGLEHALAAWGTYWRDIYLSGCKYTPKLLTDFRLMYLGYSMWQTGR